MMHARLVNTELALSKKIPHLSPEQAHSCLTSVIWQGPQLLA